MTIVCFGDSLTAGFGLAQSQSYPAVLQEELNRRGYGNRVVNLGRNGDTTHDGLRRLPEALAARPAIVVLEFGANDMLRGLPLTAAQANLGRMIGELRAAGSQVILAGFALPPALSPGYIPKFNGMYPELAARHGVTLIPSFLEGVAGNPAMMQPDYLHPNAAGARRVAEIVLKTIEPLLRREAV
jgi:acyl-CoA thioesterase-1